jgi:hypothetical protein
VPCPVAAFNLFLFIYTAQKIIVSANFSLPPPSSGPKTADNYDECRNSIGIFAKKWYI